MGKDDNSKSAADGRAEQLAKKIEELTADLEALSRGDLLEEQQRKVDALEQKLKAKSDPKLLKLQDKARKLELDLTESESDKQARELREKVEALKQKKLAQQAPAVLALQEQARKLAAEVADSEADRQARELRKEIEDLEQKKRSRSFEQDPKVRALREHLAKLKEEVEGSDEERERLKLEEEIRDLNQKKQKRNFERDPKFQKLKDELAKLRDEIEGSDEEKEQQKLEEELETLRQERQKRLAEADPKTAALKKQVEQLRAEKLKVEQEKMYRAFEDEIAELKEEMEELSNESARDDELQERRQDRQKGKLDGGFSRDLDIQQAFNFNRTRQVAFGYVTALTIGRVPLVADFTESDPMMAMGSVSATMATQEAPALKVVGAISSVSWELGTEDPIELSLRISATNKQMVLQVQYSTQAAVDVSVGFKVYEYDQGAFTYYTAFASGQTGQPIQGQIKKSRGDSGLKLKVGFEPAGEVWSPQNFELTFTMRPKTALPQQLYLGTSTTGRVIKTWG